MWNSVTASAGTILSVSPVNPAVFSKPYLENLEWIKIGEISSIGEVTTTFNGITHNTLSDRKTVKRKGAYEIETVVIQLARVGTDIGQEILKNAIDNQFPLVFRIYMSDSSVMFFYAKIFASTRNVQSVDNLHEGSFSLVFTSDILAFDPIEQLSNWWAYFFQPIIMT